MQLSSLRWSAKSLLKIPYKGNKCTTFLYLDPPLLVIRTELNIEYYDNIEIPFIFISLQSPRPVRCRLRWANRPHSALHGVQVLHSLS